ncbi:hypothetical protein PIB30_033639 [Stylosanthes scabra]|uniref:Uncharacterized protein n=1 Tax=Stylosanthes scabra TaxID=79078 RepID=A0ABU6SD53_9FABA|nr:hypothetical protein [Stylosanthes scabra]
MGNASNNEFEGHEHIMKHYDGMHFCNLVVVPLMSETKTNPGRWFFGAISGKARKLVAIITNG